MGRFDLGAAAVCAAIAFVTATQPANARAQTTAPADAAQPSAAPEPQPARKPWREAMDRAPEPPADTPENTERVWYGWQTLLVDVSSIVMLALVAEDEIVGVTGLVMLGLGSPIVHWAHGNTNGGVVSFGIRATSIGLLFLGGLLLANDVFDDDGSRDDSTEILGTASIIASIAGGLTAVILDASLFGYDTKRREPHYTNLTPWFDPQRGNYGLHFAVAL
jgi:hypothetical protein